MGSEPAVMAAESSFLAALGAADTVALDGTDLLLTGPDVELRFRPVPPVPTSRLVGTRWVLETLLDGEVASSTVGRSEIRFKADGTFTGAQDGHELAVLGDGFQVSIEEDRLTALADDRGLVYRDGSR
jgi:hypothetical protein